MQNEYLINNAQGKTVHLDTVEINGEIFYKISNVDEMRPFFMSIVSDSNHWMFLSSNGGISAGRKDSEHSLFPYYTDDKITASAENTGSKSVFWIEKNGDRYLWEPFSVRGEGRYRVTRNLYKNGFGNKVIFEEINETIGICFQYSWSSSNLYGFVRISRLTNLSEAPMQVQLLDGIQNILPYGVGSDLQNRTSNLADAYKRSELDAKSAMGIFALSAIIADKAEPSEALKANVAWSIGLEDVSYLLSAAQLKKFRNTASVEAEHDVKGESGAYLLYTSLLLPARQHKEWMVVANVNQSYPAIVQLANDILQDSGLLNKVLADVAQGTKNLLKLTASADAVQHTADSFTDARHYSNVLFNIMRGGIFDNGYQIEKWDFVNYLSKANKQVLQDAKAALTALPEIFSLFQLREAIAGTNNYDFVRLAIEYLPLKFSRRHGDPSRPWNQFSINTRSEVDGSKILDYQGNWRDIFQNWEALAHAYPGFVEGMVFRFLNASTFDGYNPYRITKDGFDWETIEPDNPWSYIGYWGDHQIIYLLKFFEFLETHKPGYLTAILGKNEFVYANVPYKIKPYEQIVKNPKDTIEFDHKADLEIRGRMHAMGADGALLVNAQQEIHHVGFMEKILATLLAKLSNFIPEGGIWMNTQRPEWNDANNALVGNGVSMVTLYYLRRFLKFVEPLLQNAPTKEFLVSAELNIFFNEIFKTFKLNQHLLTETISDGARRQVVDALGMAGSAYRTRIYENKFSGKEEAVSQNALVEFINLSIDFLEHSIRANKREDGLYHSYNLLTCKEGKAEISHLSEMLEGQVAVLSSGYLTGTEGVQLLDALRASSLYRADQNSYILYPNKNLPGFLQKNTFPQQLAEKSTLLVKLLNDGNLSILEKDRDGLLHFNGNFRNAGDLDAALRRLDNNYLPLAEKERETILAVFEEVFCHKEFTGRSGTFFGYEGLGSIYWHMVSKLLLAVQETCLRAINEGEEKTVTDALKNHYYQIREGIGVHKPPKLYGAFPIDPYSHTPENKGAQQPGMTGQVKEDILSRIGELGVFVQNGQIVFNPVLLQKTEFTKAVKQVSYINIAGEEKTILPPANSMFFTYCQVPVLYQLGAAQSVEIEKADGKIATQQSLVLPEDISKAVFNRSGEVQMIKVVVNIR